MWSDHLIMVAWWVLLNMLILLMISSHFEFSTRAAASAMPCAVRAALVLMYEAGCCSPYDPWS